MTVPFFIKRNKELIKHIITSKGNKTTYESEDVVETYVSQKELKKPEETILNALKKQLPEMKMLDIGVGAGRTTSHFANLTKEYVGIDYSKTMIQACFRRFKNCAEQSAFVNADARELVFKDNYFDFVLFSFNGIDYVVSEDRNRIIREIHRVTKKGGIFCFSTHNLNSALNRCKIQLTKNPALLFNELQRVFLLRIFNRKVWKLLRNPSKNQQYLMFNTGVHDFRLKTFYITPKEQIKQLSQHKFTNIKVYGLEDGREIKDPTDAKDPELHFLSTASFPKLNH